MWCILPPRPHYGDSIPKGRETFARLQESPRPQGVILPSKRPEPLERVGTLVRKVLVRARRAPGGLLRGVGDSVYLPSAAGGGAPGYAIGAYPHRYIGQLRRPLEL